MKRNGKKYKDLTRTNAFALLEAKGRLRSEREQRAASLWQSLAAEYRRTHGLAEGAEIPPADSALLAAATSAAIEISRTTDQLIAGRARAKAVKSLGFARSELRRCLRSLGMIGDSGEQREDQNAPPGAVKELDRVTAEIVAARQPRAESEDADVDAAST